MTVLVEELELPASNHDAIRLIIRAPLQAARVFVRRADGTLRLGGDSDLVVGAKILAWNTGVERRSYPPQWDATDVVVLTEGR